MADDADVPPPPPEGRGQQVSSLVSAMQSGEISKAELFASLSELKRAPRSPRTGAGDVQRLVGAMRAGKISKKELMASLSTMKAASEEPPPPPPRSRDKSMSGELREAEMWAELRRDSRDERPAPISVEVETSPALSSARRVRTLSPKKEPPKPKVKAHVRQPYMEGTRTLRPRATRDDGCTFRPRVKKLPRKLYPTADYQRRREDRDFLSRTQRWASERDAHVESKFKRREEAKLDECTFQPRISANSRRSAAATQVSLKTPGRLYDEEQQRQVDRDTQRDLVLRQRDADFEERHPFRPSMATNADVAPRYRSARKVREEALSRHCTFQPQVRGPSSDMQNASTYLSCDVFERLSVNLPARDEEQLIEPEPTQVTVAATPRQVEAFLARQRACDAKRERKVSRVATELAPSFQPTVKGRASSSGDGFMERLAVAARRRERKELDKAEQNARGMNEENLECTFTPEISQRASSTSRPRRSCAELSAGDALRKETTRRLLMLRREREERQQHNFQPQFATSTTVESKLRIASDPATYLERLKEDADRREAALQEKRDARVDDADAELTFAPKLTKCPAYVTRIARGLALTGRATRKAEAPAVPDFRF